MGTYFQGVITARFSQSANFQPLNIPQHSMLIMQASIVKVFSTKDIKCPQKVDTARRWAKRKLTTLKVDERRKVL